MWFRIYSLLLLFFKTYISINSNQDIAKVNAINTAIQLVRCSIEKNVIKQIYLIISSSLH